MNPNGLIEHDCEVCMSWCSLHKKLGKECCTFQPFNPYLIYDNCLAHANMLINDGLTTIKTFLFLYMYGNFIVFYSSFM